MAYDCDVRRLVIENAALIDEAKMALDEEGGRLVGQIWEHITRLAREDGGLVVGKDRNGDDFLRDKSWPLKENGDPLAAFKLDGQGEDFSEMSWIAILCGLVSDASAGLYFWFSWWDLGIRRKAWKDFLKDFFINNPCLGDAGFSLNEDGTAIIRTLALDCQCLAANCENMEKCLECVSEAVEAIFAQRAVFGDLLKKAKKLGE